MNNVKQLPKLMVFAVVAQQKSFTKAAKQLDISKSAVSQQVSQLESELGVRLLNRTTRELSLTAMGSKMLERCSVLQDQVAMMFSDLEEAGVSPSGQFAVTYPHSMQSSIVIPAIEQLCREYPNLEPRLIAEDKWIDLAENQLDVAIRAGELNDSSYRALPLGSLSEIFCATPLYLNQQGAITSLEALSRHRCIAAPWQSSKTKVVDLENGDRQTVELNHYAKCNTLPTALALVMRHMGIALLPDKLAKPMIDSGQLVNVLKHIRGPQWPVYAVHAYQQEKPIHVTRFYQILRRIFERDSFD